MCLEAVCTGTLHKAMGEEEAAFVVKMHESWENLNVRWEV